MGIKSAILSNSGLPVATQQRIQTRYRNLLRRLLASSWTIKPEGWKVARAESVQLGPVSEMYHFAQRQFGIVQLEEEILPFVNYVASTRPSVIGEIGMKGAGNSFLFMRAMSSARRFIGLDLVLQNDVKLAYLAPLTLRWSLVEADSQSQDTTRQVARLLGGERFDFLFIDGDHSYEGVKRDFTLYYPLVRSGGLIAFHDIVEDHGSRYGKPRTPTSPWAGGVHQLWKELKGHYEHREFVGDYDQDGYGIGVLVKPAATVPLGIV